MISDWNSWLNAFDVFQPRLDVSAAERFLAALESRVVAIALGRDRRIDEEAEQRVRERARRFDHRNVRDGKLDELRAGDRLGERLAVRLRRREVVRADDHERRHADARPRVAVWSMSRIAAQQPM